ncbi:hypothetical protein [Methylophilus aquaticus]|uniref:LemA family protein n=1 Tax=Methylophilus aquaticus TaxID=1971610 RepID=A0ABT9JUY8_9PROT|nr:hypothetical protein [Methylophilus aquaticus]MDP8568269.1 hypothetical protein [Methylophilus aquaticus]
MTNVYKKRKVLVVTLLLTILLFPIGVYVYNFGFVILDDHQRWAEMGSAMSGIYGPILTILTLLVLIFQLNLQEKLNRHTYDQAYVQEARADINFYLDQLSKAFASKFEDDKFVGQVLTDTFAYSTKQELLTSPLIEIAKALDKHHSSLLTSWAAYYSVLAGIGVHQRYPYENAHIAARNKAVALFSYAGCAALDNFLFAVSEERLKIPYAFASKLNE